MFGDLIPPGLGQNGNPRRINSDLSRGRRAACARRPENRRSLSNSAHDRGRTPGVRSGSSHDSARSQTRLRFVSAAAHLSRGRLHIVEGLPGQPSLHSSPGDFPGPIDHDGDRLPFPCADGIAPGRWFCFRCAHLATGRCGRTGRDAKSPRPSQDHCHPRR